MMMRIVVVRISDVPGIMLTASHIWFQQYPGRVSIHPNAAGEQRASQRGKSDSPQVTDVEWQGNDEQLNLEETFSKTSAFSSCNTLESGYPGLNSSSTSY